MKRLFFLSIMICTALVSSSCSIKKHVNNQFPPLSTTDQQVLAIKQNLNSIDSIRPSLGLYLGEDVLVSYLKREIRKGLESNQSEDLKVLWLEPVISFDKQAIVFDIDAILKVPKHHVTMKVKMKGLSAISSSSDTLYIRNAFKSVKLYDITFTKCPGLKRWAIAKLLPPILNNFINNVNGEYLRKPLVLDLNWKRNLRFDPKVVFGRTATGPVVNIERYLKTTSWKIDNNGLSILIELSRDKPISEENSLPSGEGFNEEYLTEIFSRYDSIYSQLWNKHFTALDSTTLISASLKKHELASVFNQGMSKGITFQQGYEVERENFRSEMKVFRDKVRCSWVRDNCSRDCCISEVWGNCVLWDPVCLASVAACEGLNITKVTACELAKATNELMDLGAFQGYTLGYGNTRIDLIKAMITDDLSQINLNYGGAVTGNFKAQLEIRPKWLGHILLCNSKYKKNITSRLAFDIPQQESKIFMNVTQVGDQVVLNGRFEPISYEASVNPSPLHAFLTDPNMIRQCPILWGVIGSGSAAIMIGNFFDIVKLGPEDELLLKGYTSGTYRPASFSNKLYPLDVTINDYYHYPAKVVWSEKAIEYRHNE